MFVKHIVKAAKEKLIVHIKGQSNTDLNHGDIKFLLKFFALYINSHILL